MRKTFRQRFIATVSIIQKHFSGLEKLENALDVELPSLCDGPTKLLELLEEESGVIWTDAVWELIYNKEDPQVIYNEVVALHLKDFSYSQDETKLSEENPEENLFIEQFRLAMYQLGAWEDEIENAVEKLSKKQIETCRATNVSPETLAKIVIGK